LKKYGDNLPALVLNSPKLTALLAIANRMKSRLKSLIVAP
jgi:hypothetical protein